MEGGANGIEVEKLVREYKKGPRAVDGIDLRVAPGEIYGPDGVRHIRVALTATDERIDVAVARLANLA